MQAYLAPLATIIAAVSADPTKLANFEDTLLEAVEYHVNEQTPELQYVAPLILKNLYDGNILDEDSIIRWWEQPTTLHSQEALVRAKCRPLVEWLQTPIEEEDEDEDGDGYDTEESDLLAEGEERDFNTDDEADEAAE